MANVAYSLLTCCFIYIYISPFLNCSRELCLFVGFAALKFSTKLHHDDRKNY